MSGKNEVANACVHRVYRNVGFAGGFAAFVGFTQNEEFPPSEFFVFDGGYSRTDNFGD
jgi:hypothetical protein